MEPEIIDKTELETAILTSNQVVLDGIRNRLRTAVNNGQRAMIVRSYDKPANGSGETEKVFQTPAEVEDWINAKIPEQDDTTEPSPDVTE